MKNKPSEVQTKRVRSPGAGIFSRRSGGYAWTGSVIRLIERGLRCEDHREEALEEDGQQLPDRRAADPAVVAKKLRELIEAVPRSSG